MPVKTIQFSQFHLFYIKKKEGPQAFEIESDLFKNFEESFYFNRDENTSFHIETTFTDSYAFFAMKFGKSEPRASTVTDVKTNKERENPRTIEEAELRNQVFVYYSYDKQMLFLSNQQQKLSFKKILENRLNNLVFEIKEIYGDIDSFIEAVKTVKEVRFTSTDDLFSNNQAQREALETLTGTLAPTRVTLKVDYKESKYGIEKISNWLKGLNKSQQNHALKHLVVKGDNAEGFEQIFNTENLISKVAIKVNKDENGLVENQEVLDALLSEIEN